jgi:cephalosporin-C deacetylase-like acetyl esterase
LKDYDGYFPFEVPATKEAWEVRRERVIRQLLVSQGLWPLPTKTALNPVIHGKVDRDGFTVEKVYFESMPGFFVTGSLYRPKDKKGPFPGVLCPHGHWADGRFHDAGEASVKKQIVQGAERFEEGGRSPLQACCMQLARMGCVVFHYDMLGYADSKQLSFELVHRFGKPRPEMNTAENWGFYSPQAEARLQSVMGMQTWNSIRSLDFILDLPDIDSKRIAVTGASGGGTQTMILSGIDPRVALSFPAVMVSTAMQGGCTCESSSLLRVDTGNIEFAALFAPKPQGMTSADDWTKEMKTKGFPELTQLYKLVGKPEDVTLANLVHFPHNYNYVSRSAMYAWVNKHFKLGLSEPVIEEDYKRLTTAELSVWGKDHPQPPSGDEFERKLCKLHWEDSQANLSRHVPKDAEQLEKFRKVVGGAVDVLIGHGLPAKEDIAYEQLQKEKLDGWIRMSGLMRTKSRGEEVPVMFCFPTDWNKKVVICVHEEGKAGLFGGDGQPREEVRALMKDGTAVMGLDLLFQGEFNADGQSPAQARRVKNERLFAGYTLGYNHSLFAQRVHDILSAITFVKNHDMHPPESIALLGLGETAGPLVVAARAQAGDTVKLAVVDTAGFRFAKVGDWQDPKFLPGGAKYFDLPGMLALAAPQETWVAGEGAKDLELVATAYKTAGKPDALKIKEGAGAAAAWEAVRGK